MTQTHPITPPTELVAMWIGFSARHHSEGSVDHFLDVANKAAQWGADQELEACCEWLDDTDCEDPQEASLRLRWRWHRRPNPPSLKEQALEALTAINSNFHVSEPDASVIRAALESLDD